jgi:Uma2 family endonuclease
MVAERRFFNDINFPPMSDEQFLAFCRVNPDMRIERDSDLNIIIMPPTNSETGSYNFELAGELFAWNRKHKLGKGFDSSTGFKLPTGAIYAPDLAWISQPRWDAIPETERQGFAPIAPDFVLELRSPDQTLGALKDKMEDYIAAGCRLAWLIDPQARKTWVYAENGDIQTSPFEQALSGGAVLVGFELRLADVFGG